MRSVCIGIALAVSVRAAPALSQNLPPWSTTVQVVVDADEALHSQVSSWLTEELRRMQGVAVVDSAAEWEVHIILMQTHNQSGKVTGYALSEVVLSRFDQRPIFQSLAAADTIRSHRDTWRMATTMARVTWDYRDQNLLVGPLDQMRGAIEGLAATFDTKQLEPSRKWWENARRQVRQP